MRYSFPKPFLQVSGRFHSYLYIILPMILFFRIEFLFLVGITF